MKPTDDPAVLLAITTTIGALTLLLPVAVAAAIALRLHRTRQERL